MWARRLRSRRDFGVGSLYRLGNVLTWNAFQSIKTNSRPYPSSPQRQPHAPRAIEVRRYLLHPGAILDIPAHGLFQTVRQRHLWLPAQLANLLNVQRIALVM